MKTFRAGILLICVFLFGSFALWAQSSQGRILGTVTDQSGAVVANAKITITNTNTNASRELITNAAGDYVAPSLDPGMYSVAAEASGFKKAISTAIQLEVSRDARVNLRLQPGAVSEVIEVTAQEALIDTTETTLNGVLSNKAIN